MIFSEGVAFAFLFRTFLFRASSVLLCLLVADFAPCIIYHVVPIACIELRRLELTLQRLAVTSSREGPSSIS